MTYKLLIHSAIPMVRRQDHWHTLDLWAIDLAEQRNHVAGLVLVCPVHDEKQVGAGKTLAIGPGIEILDVALCSPKQLEQAISSCDVVQLQANSEQQAAEMAKKLLLQARRLRKKVITGISSDRSRTVLMNYRKGDALDAFRALRARLAARRIRQHAIWLTSQSDGAFIVGEGLRSLVGAGCTTVHVGTASWISTSDCRKFRFVPADYGRSKLAQACIASRLERMKGIHVGIHAAAALVRNGRFDDFRLSIFGDGPERSNLHELCRSSGLDNQIKFYGSLAYPGPFLEAIGQAGVVLFPNLNDEQPRLIFDALSRGCIPIFPAHPAYLSIGLPVVLSYQQGDAIDMSRVYAALLDGKIALDEILPVLDHLRGTFTLQGMHQLRRDWVKSQVLERS